MAQQSAAPATTDACFPRQAHLSVAPTDALLQPGPPISQPGASRRRALAPVSLRPGPIRQLRPFPPAAPARAEFAGNLAAVSLGTHA